MLRGQIGEGMKSSEVAADFEPALTGQALEALIADVQRQHRVAGFRIAVRLRLGIIKRHYRADLQRGERHEISALRAGKGVVSMRLGGHVDEDPGSRDAVPVLAVAEIGLAEEAREIDAAISADLPTPPVDARAAVVEANLRTAVIACHSEQSTADAIFSADRAAIATSIETAGGGARPHVVRECVANNVDVEAVDDSRASVKIASARQGTSPLTGGSQPQV